VFEKRDEENMLLLNQECHGFYFSPNIVRMIKPRKMMRAMYVTCVGVLRNLQKIVVKVECFFFVKFLSSSRAI
jgi:hypothetical protein